MIKCRILPLLALLTLSTPAWAETPVTAGGWTDEACTGAGQNTPLTVTASSAYTAGNEVGPLLTLQFARQSGVSPAPAFRPTGIMQSLSLTSKSIQTAEFDVSFFITKPTTSTWTDKATPSITGADIQAVRGPIKLTGNFSGLGTHTVYNLDQIAKMVKLTPNNQGLIYAVITTPGTPTFASTSDLQLCVGILQD